MAMLAEPRRKQRIGPNPRGKFFAEDEDNKGRNLLQKLGWKDGEGLGVQKQGMSEPIRPKIQMNSNGLGFDIKSDPWMAHSKEYAAVLENLKTEHGGSNDNKEDTRAELETKSKHSRSRIHYHKFTRGKDLSSITSKDWTCIFGNDIKLTSSMDSNSEEVFPSPSQGDSASEAFDVTASGGDVKPSQELQINMGSMHDYFKTKMAKKLETNKQISIKTEPEEKKEKKRRNKVKPVVEDSNPEEVFPSPCQGDSASAAFDVTANGADVKPSQELQVNMGSMYDYFKTKMAKKLETNKQRSIKPEPEDFSSHVLDPTYSEPAPEPIPEAVIPQKKSKKRKPAAEAVECLKDATNQEETIVEKKEKKRRKKLKVKVEDQREEQELTVEDSKFVNMGSMHDYFKTKMAKKLESNKQISIKTEPEEKKEKKRRNKVKPVVEDSNLEKVFPSPCRGDSAFEAFDVTANGGDVKPSVEELQVNMESKHDYSKTKMAKKLETNKQISIKTEPEEKKEKKRRNKVEPVVEDNEEELGPMGEIWEKKKARFLAPDQIRKVESEFKGSNLSKIRGYGLY